MKKLKILFFFSCLVVVLSVLIFSLSGVAVAEENAIEKRYKECIDECDNKGQACININADPRMCSAVVQECADACKAEAESSQSQN